MNTWPQMPFEEWKDSCATLHRWTQIVGKTRLSTCPFINEWWNVGLKLTARGLTTGPMPVGDEDLEVEFDFVNDLLHVTCTDGRSHALFLRPQSVASFYQGFQGILHELNLDIPIMTRPVETSPAIPFEEDETHQTYDALAVRRWWRVLLKTSRVMEKFRSTFFGKSSPVLFYWGSFDLNTTRFSGRGAPPPEGPEFYQLAEDQENFACGFWPGNVNAAGVTYGKPAFYAYHYPSPGGIRKAKLPDGARFDEKMGEFLLDYDVVREARDPEALLLEFFQSTYDAGAELAGWDRSFLEPGRAPSQFV